jgi:hypothetical protein
LKSIKLKFNIFQNKTTDNEQQYSEEFQSNACHKADEFCKILNQLERACCYNPKKIAQIYRNCGSIKTSRYLMEDLENSLNNLGDMENIDQLCGFVKEYLKTYYII